MSLNCCMKDIAIKTVASAPLPVYIRPGHSARQSDVPASGPWRPHPQKAEGPRKCSRESKALCISAAPDTHAAHLERRASSLPPRAVVPGPRLGPVESWSHQKWSCLCPHTESISTAGGSHFHYI